MAFPRAHAPTYMRQNSNEPPPLLYDASFPQRQPPRNAGGARAAPSSGQPGRSNTVRGAVRGTIREPGSGGPQAKPFVPTRALTRGKTLTRPERFVAPAPLINPNAGGKNASGGATRIVNGVPTLATRAPFWDPWSFFVYGITCWAPGWIIGSCSSLKTKAKQRAWKEKVALCTIAVLMGATIAFLTIGLTRVLCPVTGTAGPATFTRLGTQGGTSDPDDERS